MAVLDLKFLDVNLWFHLLLFLKRKLGHFHLTTNPFTHLSLYSWVIYSSIHPHPHLSIHPSTHKHIHQSIHLPIYASILPLVRQIHPFLHCYIYLSTYLPVSYLQTQLIHLVHPFIYPSILHQLITRSFIYPTSFHLSKDPMDPPHHEPTNPFMHLPSLVSKLSLQRLLCSRFYGS